MCPQFNSMKQTLGIYKQRRDKLGSTTVPTLGRRSQSAIRFNPHTLQTWLCADIVQFWPLSLCHAKPRERVQGQQFAHVSSRSVTWHRERGQNCADHVLHTIREPGAQTTTRTKVVKTSLKNESASFHGVYLDSLNSSSVGDFSRSWILKDFIQGQKETPH